MTDEATYIRPEYRKTSSGHKPIDGVQFLSYRTGISRYCWISEDGQIYVSGLSFHRSTYTASVIGNGTGTLLNKSGKVLRFRTQDAAAHAGVKVWRELKATRGLAKE